MSDPLANLNNVMAAIEKKKHLGIRLDLTPHNFIPDETHRYWYCDLVVNGFKTAGACLDINDQVEYLIGRINRIPEDDQEQS